MTQHSTTPEYHELRLQRDALVEALRQVFKLLPDYPRHDPNRHIIEAARKAYHKAQGNA